MSNKLNHLERYSLIASIATLLIGRWFYTASDDEFMYSVLTVLVLVMLAANALVIIAVIILEWSPDTDAMKDFESASATPMVFLI